jgi:molecular chaperone DnaK
MKKAMEELTKVSHKLAEEIYKQSAAKQAQDKQEASGGQEEQPKEKKSSGGKDEEIIDAEYKAEDEDKK